MFETHKQNVIIIQTVLVIFCHRHNGKSLQHYVNRLYCTQPAPLGFITNIFYCSEVVNINLFCQSITCALI